MPSDGSSAPIRKDTPGLPSINNDHVFAPDLRRFFASANDGHVYEVMLDSRPAGQGTINVNSWSPDGTRFAFVAYPLDA